MRSSRLALLVFFAAAVATGIGLAGAKDTPSAAAAAEAKLRSEAARELAAYVELCAQAGKKDEGRRALDEAKALAPGTSVIAGAESSLDGVPVARADGTPAPDVERGLAHDKIAKLYDKLALLDHDPKDAARFERYLFAAYRWAGTKGRLGRIQKAVDDAARANRAEDAGRLLVGLRLLDDEGAAAGRYERVELDLATKDACLLGSTVNELVAWVSLPRDWVKGKTYPILVGVDGAGSNFLGYARGSKGVRGSRPLILVCPCTLSNTNALDAAKYPMYDPALLAAWDAKRLAFDGPGVDGVLDVVRRRFGGEEKIFVTGFSGGGNYTYWKLLCDPAHVRGACPACANYSGGGLEGAPGAGPDGGPVVQLMTAEKDEFRDTAFGGPGIEPQTDAAQKALAGLGYAHVTRIVVPGSGHSPLHAQVYEFIDRVLGAR